MTIKRKEIRQRIHKRIRRKVNGTQERPRLAIHISNQHVYAQVIDDVKRVTVASASTHVEGVGNGATVATATKVGQLVAERAKSAGVANVVFDRGGHIYHGKVKALADAARSAGLQF
jgi:large subunit ribosomal protein L18